MNVKKIKDKVGVKKIFEHFKVDMVSDTKAVCPFHDDHDPSISIKDDVIWSCWVCGVTGDIIKFVEMKLNISFKEAIKWFENYFGVSEKKTLVVERNEEEDISKKYDYYFEKIEDKIVNKIKSQKVDPSKAQEIYFKLDKLDVKPKDDKHFEILKKELFSL